MKRLLYNAASMKNKCCEDYLDLGHKASKGGMKNTGTCKVLVGKSQHTRLLGLP
jgi:hypothetical protein